MGKKRKNQTPMHESAQVWLIVEPRLRIIAYKRLRGLKALSNACGHMPPYEHPDEVISEMWRKIKDKDRRNMLPEFSSSTEFAYFCRDIIRDIIRRAGDRVANSSTTITYKSPSPHDEEDGTPEYEVESPNSNPEDVLLLIDFLDFLERKNSKAAEVARLLSMGMDDVEMISKQTGIKKRQVYVLRTEIRSFLVKYNRGEN